MKFKTYSELSQLKTIKERYEYLKLDGVVGEMTFGFERYLNQKFYSTKAWKETRNFVIARDLGCDLGVPGYEIRGRIIIHHMNPIATSDIVNQTDILLNPEYLVCVSYDTHNAIHYGDSSLLPIDNFVERKPNDTCPWKR